MANEQIQQRLEAAVQGLFLGVLIGICAGGFVALETGGSTITGKISPHAFQNGLITFFAAVSLCLLISQLIPRDCNNGCQGLFNCCFPRAQRNTDDVTINGERTSLHTHYGSLA